MTKLVTLSSGKVFPTVTAAKAYFAEILNGQELKQVFTESDFADIEDVYVAYCTTTNWPLPSAPASFYPVHDRGPGYTTRCFGVTFEDGTTGKFSMDKALRAIAA